MPQFSVRSRSTDSTIRDAAKNILNGPRAEFRFQGVNRSNSAKCPIGSVQPASRSLRFAETFTSQLDDTGEAIEPVGFEIRQAATSSMTFHSLHHRFAFAQASILPSAF